MERPPDELYDPVIVVDATGILLGTATIRQLIMRSTALEVQSAQGSSPLTGLPGNRSIELWILRALEQRDAHVLYADLDCFKEYNDCYGFLRGDKLIRCLARVLSRGLSTLSTDAKLDTLAGTISSLCRRRWSTRTRSKHCAVSSILRRSICSIQGTWSVVSSAPLTAGAKRSKCRSLR